jgi:hypothetical protein
MGKLTDFPHTFRTIPTPYGHDYRLTWKARTMTLIAAILGALLVLGVWNGWIPVDF